MKRKDLAKLTEFVIALLSFLMAIMIMTVESISLSFQSRMIVGGYFLFVSLLCVWFLILRRMKELNIKRRLDSIGSRLSKYEKMTEVRTCTKCGVEYQVYDSYSSDDEYCSLLCSQYDQI